MAIMKLAPVGDEAKDDEKDDERDSI